MGYFCTRQRSAQMYNGLSWSTQDKSGPEVEGRGAHLAICHPSGAYFQDHQSVDDHFQYMPCYGRTATCLSAILLP